MSATEHACVSTADLAHMIVTKQVATIEVKRTTLARAQETQAAPNCLITV